MTDQHAAVAPIAPPAPWTGGKRRLAARIIARLSALPHRTYVEPFVGMGGLFFRRPTRAPAEVINDISADVATLFRVLQRHYVPLMDMLRWQVTSRAEFERLVAARADTLTDLERAARFLYLQRTGFGGKVVGRSFGVSVASPARFDVQRLGAILEAVHERLSSVVIERLPYGALIDRYDRAETLFYLDPPYAGSETMYGPGVFAEADFVSLAEQLRRIRGRFLLSLNDTPLVREAFAGFAMEEVDVAYSLSREQAGRRAFRELIISREGDGRGGT
jgi:DNA adenine methylase